MPSPIPAKSMQGSVHPLKMGKIPTKLELCSPITGEFIYQYALRNQKKLPVDCYFNKFQGQ